jgi:peroxiredoxin Q/BCP
LSGLLAEGPLILYFYPADFTPGCTKEACSFPRPAPGSCESRSARGRREPTGHGLASALCEKHALNFTLLSDPEKKVIKAYKLDGPLASACDGALT